MLVVGGVRSVTGAVVGALFVATLNEVLRYLQGGPTIGPIAFPDVPGLQAFGVALITLLVLMFRPTGLTRGREIGLAPPASHAAHPAVDRTSAD
jgi:branched-chain amino acid transport system permease protein